MDVSIPVTSDIPHPSALPPPRNAHLDRRNSLRWRSVLRASIGRALMPKLAAGPIVPGGPGARIHLQQVPKHRARLGVQGMPKPPRVRESQGTGAGTSRRTRAEGEPPCKPETCFAISHAVATAKRRGHNGALCSQITSGSQPVAEHSPAIDFYLVLWWARARHSRSACRLAAPQKVFSNRHIRSVLSPACP